MNRIVSISILILTLGISYVAYKASPAVPRTFTLDIGFSFPTFAPRVIPVLVTGIHSSGASGAR